MADTYEREQMQGVGEVLYRHKVTSPRWLMGLMAGLPLVLGGAAGIASALSGDPLGGAGIFGGTFAFSAVMSALMVTFASARIAVSEGELHLQIGFAGPRIPIEQIARAYLAPSGTNRRGMGVSNDLRGTTIYTLWGDNEKGVHVERADGTKIVVVMKEPEALLEAIERALARKGGLRARVEQDGAEAQALEEQEAHGAVSRRGRR